MSKDSFQDYLNVLRQRPGHEHILDLTPHSLWKAARLWKGPYCSNIVWENTWADIYTVASEVLRERQ